VSDGRDLTPRTIVSMLVMSGWLTLSIWIYLFLFHGRFWRINSILAPNTRETHELETPISAAAPARVAVIIPARNETDLIGRTVTSMLQQTGPLSLDIFVIDDSSSDGTAQAALAAARDVKQTQRATVSIIQGKPLVPGWSGKLWAVEQGIERASALSPDFFLLTDADIEHAPDSAATLVGIAQQGDYDLASFMVRLHCETFAERALLPAFVFFFLKLYPPSWIANPRRSMAGAAGGSILIRPEALRRAGGIESIRGEVIDDCALARRVKESGGKIWLGMARETRSIRPYGTFTEIGRMISRGAFNQLRHSAWMLLLAISGLTVTYLLPPILVFFSHRWLPAILGGAAWLLMAICFLPMVRLYRLNPLWTLALPLIAIFYMGAAVHSAFKYWSGRGGEWKGRIQDPAL
jgi:hopene-associated glycosyltransferase HpnB